MTAGGAANVAMNIAGLGAKPLLVGTVGNDNDAKILTDYLTSCKISCDHLVKSERPTSVKTRIVAHSQHVVRVDREEAVPLSKQGESEISHSIDRAIGSANIVVLSDYAKGTLTNTVLRSAIDAAARKNVPVLVDPKGKDFSKYHGVSVLTPNRREALEACRLDDNQINVVTVAGNRLVTELDLDAVVITEGDKGMKLFEKGKEPVNFKAVAHDIYDVTGAGDTVIACLAVALAAGLPQYEAVQLANLAAGLVVEQVGTTAVSIMDLIQKVNYTNSPARMTDAANP
jgi:D-beta-D-heptose 7-phosphate kinase/D-beta-D-heptose 1-phosphate adenosyltransferase